MEDNQELNHEEGMRINLVFGAVLVILILILFFLVAYNFWRWSF